MKLEVIYNVFQNSASPASKLNESIKLQLVNPFMFLILKEIWI